MIRPERRIVFELKMRNVDAEFGLLEEHACTCSSSAERNPGSVPSRRALRRVRFGVRLPDPSGEPGSDTPEARVASRFELLTLRRIRYGVQWSSRRWKGDRVLRCFGFVLLRFALRVSSNGCSIFLPHFDLILILIWSSSLLLSYQAHLFTSAAEWNRRTRLISNSSFQNCSPAPPTVSFC